MMSNNVINLLQVAFLKETWEPLPLLIMGGAALVAGLLALINLPETLGERLPESVEEALALGASNRNSKKKTASI